MGQHFSKELMGIPNVKQTMPSPVPAKTRVKGILNY